MTGPTKRDIENRLNELDDDRDDDDRRIVLKETTVGTGRYGDLEEEETETETTVIELGGSS
jgi:hypothetical protein